MEYQKVGASDGMGTVIADNAAMFHRIAELEAQLAACQQETAECKSDIEETRKQRRGSRSRFLLAWLDEYAKDGE